MISKVENHDRNVIAFRPKAPACGHWAVAQHFQNIQHISPANDNYGPSAFEGAQTSDLLLDFLYGVAQ
ncbi:hypothetical protein SAMN04488040_0324 [Sulfitobacter marinus]|uniref:Uncharacterized protein n=1 Tax=Sulfitobacter marinus TaxID=394264 RepID=A0A1I6PT62_9RHOB|nr:hypothetical protein [Sulfitobacter marinus]SFS43414.1 hypothetical protein SAMN04488040_0324 [Sulfitobacter marinus]